MIVVSFIIVTTVILASTFLQYKKVKRWYLFASLQLVGLIALLGLIPYPVISGIIYVVFLSIVLSLNNQRSKSLSTTPIYTMAFLSVFYMLLHVELESKNEHIESVIDAMVQILPTNTGGVWLFTYIASLISMLWFNLLTERHSIAVYILIALGACLSFIPYLFFQTSFDLL